MPWKVNLAMDLRQDFIQHYQTGIYSLSELCRQYSITRKTAYKWLRRYETDGPNGLEDQSRKPHTCPHEMPEDVSSLLIELRRTHPTWGPLKLLAYVQNKAESALPKNKRYIQIVERLPAASTLGDRLKREGLVSCRKKRSSYQRSAQKPIKADHPNDLWCIDFKGEFRTGDSLYCYPFTVTDARSRYLLCVDAYLSTSYAGVLSSMMGLFERYGMPQAIRSDGGSPFCACNSSWKGLSRFGVLLARLGIEHQIDDPAHPEQNGRHERMHLTLKMETALVPACNCHLQHERMSLFQKEYNQERPHQAIDMKTPSSLYHPSARRLPSPIEEPQYAGYMEKRLVSSDGYIKFRNQSLFVSSVLANDYVALAETAEGIWSVYFYNRLLARVDERNWKVIPAGPFVPLTD